MVAEDGMSGEDDGRPKSSDGEDFYRLTLISCNQQCQSTEGNTKVPILAIIQHESPDERDVASFMLALQRQYC